MVFFVRSVGSVAGRRKKRCLVYTRAQNSPPPTPPPHSRKERGKESTRGVCGTTGVKMQKRWSGTPRRRRHELGVGGGSPGAGFTASWGGGGKGWRGEGVAGLEG